MSASLFPLVLATVVSAGGCAPISAHVVPIQPLFLTDSAHREWIPLNPSARPISAVAPGYAGMWVDEPKGTLNIGLIDLADSLKVLPLLTERMQKMKLHQVAFQKRKYDYVQLDYWSCRIGKAFGGDFTDIVGYGIRDPENVIHVYVLNQKGIDRIRRLVRELGIPNDAVAIRITAPVSDL